MFSIVIPTYNRAAIISRTLDSVLAQTYQDWECLIVDDFSTDNTRALIEEYQQKGARIKIFRHEENKKQGAARNKGLEVATVEYIWFVDSDDYIDTKACQVLYDAIKEFNVNMLCFSALQFSETEENRTFSYPQYFQGVQTNKIYHPKTNWKELRFSNLNVVPWAYISKRNVIQDFKFRESVWYEDTDFTTILLASADSFCYIPYTAYFHRINPTSTVQTAMSEKKLKDLISMLEYLDKFITQNNIDREHFLYELLVAQIDYIFELYQSTENMTPNNLNILLELKTRYRKPKNHIKRLIGKIFKKLLGEF